MTRLRGSQVGMLATGVALGAVLALSVHSLVEPPDANDDRQRGYVVAEVADATVSRSLTATATAQWAVSATYPVQLDGVVTATHVTAVDTVHTGDRLYEVDLQPVVVAQGSVPAFRDLVPGVRGPDVAQLQAMLKELGYREQNASGNFDDATSEEVRKWQKGLGAATTGEVKRGALVFVPKLPVRGYLSSDIRVGASPLGQSSVLATTSAGETSTPSGFTVVTGEPVFRAGVASSQSALIPDECAATITLGERTLPARLSARRTEETGTVSVGLRGVEGASLCGTDCEVPPQGLTEIPVQFEVVPETSGPTVPVAAIHLDAQQRTIVVSEDGAEIPVTVRASSDGLAVVDGLGPVEAVRIPRIDDGP